MIVPTKILELVERFDRNLEAYKQRGLNFAVQPPLSYRGWLNPITYILFPFRPTKTLGQPSFFEKTFEV